VLVLVTMFLRRLAVEGSHLTRLLIASARELIADAESVRLTQNRPRWSRRSAVSKGAASSRVSPPGRTP
jgi:hypothetical protein